MAEEVLYGIYNWPYPRSITSRPTKNRLLYRTGSRHQGKGLNVARYLLDAILQETNTSPSRRGVKRFVSFDWPFLVYFLLEFEAISIESIHSPSNWPFPLSFLGILRLEYTIFAMTTTSYVAYAHVI